MTTNRLVYIVNEDFLNNNPNVFLNLSKLEFAATNTYTKVFIPKVALACTAYKRIITNYYTSTAEQQLRLDALHSGVPTVLTSKTVTITEPEVGLDSEDLYNALEFASQPITLINETNVIGQMVSETQANYPEGLSFGVLMKNFKTDNLSVFYQYPY